MKKVLLICLFLLTTMYGFSQKGSIKTNTELAIIPQPKFVTTVQKKLNITALKELELPNDWRDLGEQIIDFNKKNNLIAIRIVAKSKNTAIIIKKVSNLGMESYKLDINDNGVSIEASDYGGAFNALQTWKQIVWQAKNNTITHLKIEDQPRFNYRGLMIDCSRHFWTVDELKQTITQMSFFKLNKLHLHLTDNNAWRIEIKGYPKLTSAGTYYKDYPELSNKFYTQEDLKQVVAFAGKHNIEVIPEIDLPGHAIGILAAYPELSCTGGEFEVFPEEMPMKDRKRGHINMVCLGNPDVYTFAEKVIQELVAIFPSQKIHLGGDEVPTNIWEKCTKCQKLYQDQKLNNWGELQDYFTIKMAEIVKKQGKTMVGWDEINERHAASPEDIVMAWRDYGFKQAAEALERNVPVIMAPQHGCYFDWGYAGNATRKVYEWDPISSEMEVLNKNNLVLGGQACLWTERVATQDRLEEMLYPRITALAEVLWSPKESRNWDSYLGRLNQSYDMMKALGINYYVDDAIAESEFIPKKEKPALVRHAYLTTNLQNHGNYHVEYIFDGKSNTFYWGNRSIGVGDWYQIQLGEPIQTNKVSVITGDSKDYIQYADLLVSEDGETFKKVASFTDDGMAEANLEGKTIRAIRIEATKQHTSWPVIKEVKIE
ncbi:hexosaminidase [Flavobacterium sp. PL11]|uniref:glycoside hydrolase family 20 protein n=1 Tax=Flavobacterium sp. PL11 TaxID=3071717 RepID=UPI002E074C17|nr:hexosaminidase [Flavobacterium sp. PL11]